jgi:hypothetical protein
MDMHTIPPEPFKEPTKKYIRTFEQDAETLKKGGVPNLKLFTEPAPAPVEDSIEVSPDISTPIPAPIEAPEPIPEPAPLPIEVPVPAPVEPVPPPEQKPTPIQTYSSDFRDRMKETNASTLTVLAAEQDSAPLPSGNAPNESRRNILYSIAAVLLLIVGGIGVYIAYVRYAVSITPITIAPVSSTLIFVDSRTSVSGSHTDLVQAIQQEISRPISPNTIELLSLANTSTTSMSVFSSLGLHAPAILMRNIKASNSMAGVVNVQGTQSPFFIVSVGEYSPAFAGMLSWEPIMPDDFSGLFPPYSEPTIAALTATTTMAMATSTVATTTAKVTATSTQKVVVKTVPISTSPMQKPGFHDEVVSNHDVRVYRDSMNRVIMLYGFWNQTTFVIARNAASFTEIIGRLSTSAGQ